VPAAVSGSHRLPELVSGSISPFAPAVEAWILKHVQPDAVHVPR